MTNLDALSAQCRLICSTCYVDSDVLRLTLEQNGISAEDEAELPSKDIVRSAILIVRGWVETSHSEGGISTSIDTEQLNRSIIYWCGQCGLDASEFCNVSTIEDGSNLW